MNESSTQQASLQRAASALSQKPGEADLAAVQFSQRRRLPETRHSLTHKFHVSGQEGYITVGLFEDGAPGEVFIKMAKEGSTLGGLMDTIGVLTSLALQYGVPVEKLADKLGGTQFEPAGHTGNSELPEASSLSDYLFRWLALRFAKDQTAPTETRPSEAQ